jgi:hypothetical protein
MKVISIIRNIRFYRDVCRIIRVFTGTLDTRVIRVERVAIMNISVIRNTRDIRGN